MLLHYSAGPRFGDDASHDLHTARRKKAKAEMTCEFQLAPGASVHLSGDRVLKGGDEITTNDVTRSDLGKLVALGVVFHADPTELKNRQCSATARYVVAAGGSISCPRGIIPEGGELLASDVPKESMAQFISAGKVIDRKAQPTPPAAA